MIGDEMYLVCILKGFVSIVLQYVHILGEVCIAPALCKLPVGFCNRAGQLPCLHDVTALLAEPWMLQRRLHSSFTLQGKRTEGLNEGLSAHA